MTGSIKVERGDRNYLCLFVFCCLSYDSEIVFIQLASPYLFYLIPPLIPHLHLSLPRLSAPPHVAAV